MIDRRSLIVGAGLLGTASATRLLAFALEEIDTIYVNGRIWTGVPAAPTTHAIGIAGERIVAVGVAAHRRKTPKTRVIDLRGAFVVPGLIDTHVHFLMGAFSLTEVKLRDAKTPAEMAARLGAYAARLQPGEWILGGSWDHEHWGAILPTAQQIDAATPNNPVAIIRLDGHMYLLNSLAMKLASIDRNTPDPPGGKIERDPQGNPTGIVKDGAKGLADRVIPPPSFEREDQALQVGIQHALSMGLTQIHNMGETWREHDAFRRARARNQTAMRFYSFVPLADHERLAELVRKEGRGDRWVRWGGLKGFADGSLGSGTALFHQPYSDEPGNRGLAVTPSATLTERAEAAEREKLQVTVHCIGDAANDEMLDVYQSIAARYGRRDRRSRIEHAQHLSVSAIARFGKLGVIPSMQPQHLADDGRWADRRIGLERLPGTYAFASVLKAHAHLSFGSDWPIVEAEPLAAIEAAVTRQTIDGAHPGGWIPQEKISVDAALRASTMGGAYAGFQEKELGQIRPGMLADFVILSDSPFEVKPDRISKIAVIGTIVGGQQRYSQTGG